MRSLLSSDKLKARSKAAVFIEDSGKFSPQCGGALISEEHIITASHCVVENGRTMAANRFKVRLGEHNIAERSKEDAEVDYEVRSVRAHPKFEPSTYKNDIAILHLSRKVGPLWSLWFHCWHSSTSGSFKSANLADMSAFRYTSAHIGAKYRSKRSHHWMGKTCLQWSIEWCSARSRCRNSVQRRVQ